MDEVNPEDRQIIERLAKLQAMYDQIGGLRTLLPEKLINPTRFALDNPGGYQPEKLAAYLHAAAQTGSHDVERFKKEWHSEDVRQLLSAVNASELPQGADAWVMDYAGLLHGGDGAGAGDSTDVMGDPDLDTQKSENIQETVSSFKANHPDLRTESLDEATGLPIDVTFAQLKFQVDRAPDGMGYKVIGRPKTEASALRKSIVENLQENSNLLDLLETLAAYGDIKSRPCDKCKKLVSKKHQLPFVRKSAGSSPGQQPRFLAFHRDCV